MIRCPTIAASDLEAVAAVLRLSDLLTPMAVRVAATIRLADHLTDGPRTAAALAEATGTNSGALDRLLAHLATAGVVRARRTTGTR